MHFFTLAFLALTARPALTGSYEYSTLRACTTEYGPESVCEVETFSYAYKLTAYSTVTRKATVTPTSTITPRPRTSTATATSTATSIIITTPTLTFYSTTYVTSTSTSTTVVTTQANTVTTTTTNIAITTVSTSPGFTPLASEPGYVPKKRSAEVTSVPRPAIRGRPGQERAAQYAICPLVGKLNSWWQYPQTVKCGTVVIAKTTKDKTYTATSTVSTTLPVVTDTVTSLTITTVTSVFAAGPASTTVTTTLTASTSTVTTSVTTTTSTQTITIVQAATTVYAACSANNVINHANGNQGIYVVDFSGSSSGSPTTNQVVASDAVSCCEQCQTTSGCTGFAQYPDSTLCYIFSFTNGQCDGSQNFGQLYRTTSGLSPDMGYAIGNGQCGQIGNGGGSEASISG